VGLVLEAPTHTAGVPGTAATWVAPTGTPAARAADEKGVLFIRWLELGLAVAPAVGARTPRAHGAREGRVRVFLGGALRCLADKPLPIFFCFYPFFLEFKPRLFICCCPSPPQGMISADIACSRSCLAASPGSVMRGRCG
jgi:hypothetical protein